MQNNKEHLDELKFIRSLMERSSKFVSLSGMAGIGAGVTAVIGAIIVSIFLDINVFTKVPPPEISGFPTVGTGIIISLAVAALAVFIIALSITIYFSTRKAKKKNLIFWDDMSKRIFMHLFIFLLTGGMFCLILIYYNIYFLIVPSMLIFYGLALINVSKFTFNEILQLGIFEIVLGIVSSFITNYPLLMWIIGFGVLHLIYGVYVYIKYERA